MWQIVSARWGSDLPFDERFIQCPSQKTRFTKRLGVRDKTNAIDDATIWLSERDLNPEVGLCGPIGGSSYFIDFGEDVSNAILFKLAFG